jgi:ribonuclease Z
MRITLLGTGSPIPDARRAGPSTLVTADGLTVLVDCGRGVLMRLVAAGVLPPFLDGLLITHLHSDHITDLGDVITTRWVMSPMARPLTIWGPPGIDEVVQHTLASLAPDVQYRLDHHADLTEGPSVTTVEVRPGDTFTLGSATVTRRRHRPPPVEPTVAFRIEVGGKSAVLGGDGVPCAGL